MGQGCGKYGMEKRGQEYGQGRDKKKSQLKFIASTPKLRIFFLLTTQGHVVDESSFPGFFFVYLIKKNRRKWKKTKDSLRFDRSQQSENSTKWLRRPRRAPWTRENRSRLNRIWGLFQVKDSGWDLHVVGSDAKGLTKYGMLFCLQKCQAIHALISASYGWSKNHLTIYVLCLWKSTFIR